MKFCNSFWSAASLAVSSPVMTSALSVSTSSKYEISPFVPPSDRIASLNCVSSLEGSYLFIFSSLLVCVFIVWK
ncbi:hypothetical protein BDB01DRAFT_790042 [Pilobolus umbonatus]|nr:hypothetical protein BDB01DRAFT_790042 [Pilobolus umbonatus]